MVYEFTTITMICAYVVRAQFGLLFVIVLGTYHLPPVFILPPRQTDYHHLH